MTDKKQLSHKKFQFPNVYVLLFFIAVFAAILTWVVPAGKFERTIEKGITQVIPGSFAFVEQNPQNPWQIFRAIVTGFKNQISLIMMVIFVGAAIHMLEASKAIDLAFRKLAQSVKGKESIAILLIMAVMSLGGATGVFGNVTLVLVPIGILLSLAMGFDRTLGFAMIFFGSFSGFNVGWANFGTIGLAQTIAQLPIFSGIGFRFFAHFINFILSYGFVILYYSRIKKDPTLSLNYEAGMKKEDYWGTKETNSDSVIKLSNGQALSLITATAGIVLVVFGALKWKWSADHISAAFLVVSILIGLFNGNGLNATFDLFIKGCSTVVSAAFIIGFANGITVLMGQGLILDTIVYYLSIPISELGAVAGANFMLLANIIVNFFISSGSGQASAVMPIMVPLADLTGITRQVAVQAFQFGDGFTNVIIPTVGSLMGGLGFAKVAYSKYLRWVLPLVLIQIALSFVAITVLQTIGWTGL